MELVKKVTIKKCAGDPKRLIAMHAKKDKAGVPVNGASMPILRVAGRCTGASLEMTDYGEYIRLRGQFRAMQLLPDNEDGVLSEFASAVAILPDVASLPIYEALNLTGESEEVSEEAKSATDTRGQKRRSRQIRSVRAPELLEFAYDITLSVDADAATGYTYGCTPLIKPSADDAMEKLVSNLPRIEAPKKSA